MPEGPELRVSANSLNRRYVGFYVACTGEFHGRYEKKPPEGFLEFEADRAKHGDVKVLDIDVKGKFMYWSLERDWYIWCTYGMSGQFGNEFTKHTAFSLGLTKSDDDSITCRRLRFNDPRHFGTVKFVQGKDKLDKKLASLGPDMLKEPSAVLFAERLLKKSDKTIAEVLMDQKIVSGVGNYIRAEALYRTGVSPWRKVVDFSSEEIIALRDAIVNVMQESVKTLGASFSTYKNPDGSSGETQKRFAVYGHKLDPKGNAVINEEAADGRTIWWCPEIQK